MHFEILVENQSGKIFLDLIIPQLIGKEHTFHVHAYKGIGRIPKNLHGRNNPADRLLLQNLPKILRGYGNTFKNDPENYRRVVLVVCDLDKKCLHLFRQELLKMLHACDPKPETVFCIAVEEMEAWLLGDVPAVKKAYPSAQSAVLNRYENDSICDTWECLADAVYKGGRASLSSKGYQAVGFEKAQWAHTICPHMNVHRNKSPSFRYLKKKLEELIQNNA